eukprot:TRINITY_DN24021_c0_g1_i2.p1 TRINITY_DN24021_c0_g1~~TRINITY_DN24021_c0_g1_i2.p1  ORF type:complete len:154 (+),score=1.37 TRINITY_DN24021_c0_g1_i2:48-464(+)
MANIKRVYADPSPFRLLERRKSTNVRPRYMTPILGSSSQALKKEIKSTRPSLNNTCSKKELLEYHTPRARPIQVYLKHPIDTKLPSLQNNRQKLSAIEFSEKQGVLSTPNSPKHVLSCLLYTSPSPRDLSTSRMPSSA